MHLSIHSQSPGFKLMMLHVPSVADKDYSRLFTLLFGNYNAGSQYPISSYQIEMTEFGLSILILILGKSSGFIG